jgi:hypothetical protein
VLSESTDRVLDFKYKRPHNIIENVIKEICCTVNPVYWNVIKLMLSSVVQRARGDYVTSRFERECLNPRQQVSTQKYCKPSRLACFPLNQILL